MSDFDICLYDRQVHGSCRKDFSCGEPSLDLYLKTQLSQDDRALVAKPYMATLGKELVGFYTLSSGSVQLDELPPELAARLPRYGQVPIIRMGRLAVDSRFQGGGYGGVLLADAFEVARTAQVAAIALVVDALHERAAAWYAKHGFRPIPGNPLLLFRRF